MRYKRIIVIDPNLKDTFGHSYRYVESLTKYYPKSKICLVTGDKSLHIPNKSIKVLPAIEEDIYDTMAREHALILPKIEARLERFLSHHDDGVVSQGGVGRLLTFALGLTLRFIRLLSVGIKLFPSLFKGSVSYPDLFALKVKKQLNKLSLKETDLVVFQTMMWPQFESMMELLVLSKHKAYKADAIFILHDDARQYFSHYQQFSQNSFKKRIQENLPFKQSKVLVTNNNLKHYAENVYGAEVELMVDINDPQWMQKVVQENQGAILNLKTDSTRVIVPGPYRGDKNFEALLEYVPLLLKKRSEVDIIVHKSVYVQLGSDLAQYDNVSFYETCEDYKDFIVLLASADLLFLPYGDTYLNRISGILHEASSINVPCLCHAEVADAANIALDDGVFHSIADAVDKSLNIIDLKSGGVVQSYYKAKQALNIFEHLESTDKWIDFIKKPVAVQLCPAWTRCGSTSIFEDQAKELVDNGYFVAQLFLNGGLLNYKEIALREWERQIHYSNRQYVGGSISRVLPKLPNVFDLLRFLKEGRKKYGVAKRAETMTWAKVDRPLKSFLKSGVDIELCNHVYHAELAKDLFKAKRRICETHDIQARQEKLRFGDDYDYSKSVNSELDVLAEFDDLINLNLAEHRFFDKALTNNSHYIVPYIRDYSDQLLYENLSELYENEAVDLDKQLLADISVVSEVDLLFIGDGHKANVQSLQWFIDECFPKLKNVSLVIVGSICNKLKLNADVEGVYLLGYLDALANIYDFAKVNLLPDKAGAGIPIKTQTILAKQLCFSATPLAMRAFDENILVEKFGHDFNDNWIIQDIECLLADDNYHKQRLSLSKELSHFQSEGLYEKEWSKLLRSKSA